MEKRLWKVRYYLLVTKEETTSWFEDYVAIRSTDIVEVKEYLEKLRRRSIVIEEAAYLGEVFIHED